VANPYITIGAVAVGIVAAAFGVFAVPGWITSAQDAAAMKDLGNIRTAQANEYTLHERYGVDLASFGDGEWGVEVDMSDGVTLAGISASDDDWCASTKSQSGTYFAVTGDNTDFGRGATAAAALRDAGCDLDLADQIDLGQLSAAFTLNCPTTVDVRLPLGGAKGTLMWSDGETTTVNGETPLKKLQANTEYKVRFEGTFTELSAITLGGDRVPYAARPCFRAMDAWTDQSKTTNAFNAFSGMRNLTSVPAHLPSTVKSTVGMFENAVLFNDPDVVKWDTSNVTNMAGMFTNARVFNQPLGTWDVSQVRSLDSMFWNATVFNQPLNDWDVDNVESMYRTFSNAAAFHQSLDGWNVAKVSNMAEMFKGAAKFNADISGWKVANLQLASQMFSGATVFNQPIGAWKLSRVQDLSFFFANAAAFNQPLDGWNVSTATKMSYMFLSAGSFNQPLNSWDVSNVESMDAMFLAAASFNQPLASWNTSKVTTFSHMFSDAKAFNQPLSSWVVTKSGSFYRMFKGATAFNQNLNAWNTSADQSATWTEFAPHLSADKLPTGMPRS
jgi:hypothetical protein